MALAPLQTLPPYTTGANTGTSAVSPIAVPDPIAVGSVVTLAVSRISATTTVNGVNTVVPSSGAHGGLTKLADANRVSTHDVSLLVFRVTTAIVAGSTLTVNHRSSSNRRMVVGAVWGDITSTTADATSGVTADNQNGDVNRGPNGSGTSLAALTAAATTQGARLVLAAIAASAGATVNTPPGWTRLTETITAGGSADRRLILFYRFDKTPSVKGISTDYTPSGSWAGGIAALPGSFVIPDGWQRGSIALGA